MMDNIREKLVELLGSLTTVQVFCDMDGDPVSRLVSRVVAEDDVDGLADHLIANGVTVQEWIPVTERLPNDGVRVLALHDDGVVRIGSSIGYFPSVVSRTHTKAFGIAEVTHWMLMPQPPKGE